MSPRKSRSMLSVLCSRFSNRMRVVFILETILTCTICFCLFVLNPTSLDFVLRFQPVRCNLGAMGDSNSTLAERTSRPAMHQRAKLCVKYNYSNFSWSLNFNGVPISLRLSLSSGPEDKSHLSREKQCQGVPPRPVLPCDADCEGMRTLLKQWPLHKPRAAIYFLTQLKRLNTFKDTLQRLHAFFNDRYHYPIIVFFDDGDNYSDGVKRKIRAWTNSTIFFQSVHFEMPAHIARQHVPKKSCYKSVGYRHMCRFHAQEVYHQPILDGLDYVLRLDDDSQFLRSIDYDVFDVLKRKRCRYGYIIILQDLDRCVAGLWEATCKYARKQGITSQFLDRWPHKQIFYNNFEVSELALWRSCAYRHFVDYIDRLGGIFYYRWGDAPIRSLAVVLLVPETQIHHYSDIRYKHQSIRLS